jgi:hypothetical protein
MMDSPHSLVNEAGKLLEELYNLNRQQSDALLKAAYDLMSKSEKEAYDRRCLHIARLSELLKQSSIDVPSNI